MARTHTKLIGRSSFAALSLVAASALVSVAPAAAATTHHGRSGGQLYIFKGTVAAAPAPGTASLQVTITGGNRPALKALVGNTAAPLSFTVDGRTAYVAWSASARGNAPSATTSDTLKAGDPVHLRILARHAAPLTRLLARPTRSVNDFAGAQKVAGRLFAFHGRTLAVDTAAKTVTVDVRTGNWFALNAMLGQPSTETFHYDAATLFIAWHKRTPQIFDPAAIKVGDPITLRTRGTFTTPLADLLAAPLYKINDHESLGSLASDGAALPLDN